MGVRIRNWKQGEREAPHGADLGRRELTPTPALPRRGGEMSGQAVASSAETVSKAQSSHGVRASRSVCSTVAPHQIRSPGGASR